MAAGAGIHGMLERGQRYDAPATTLRFANNGIATRARFLSPPVIPKF
jgi:hypothetical protein